MVKGVQIVGAHHDGTTRAYTSHWVTQVSFEEPIVMASISPKHDTYPLIVASGAFTVSLLAADQIAEGQYFSYPGHRFAYVADEYLTTASEDHPDGPVDIVPGCIAWLRCTVLDVQDSVGGVPLDHRPVFARVTETGDVGRLKEPPLLYSSRLGWRQAGGPAREPGVSIRDRLLERLARGEQSEPM